MNTNDQLRRIYDYLFEEAHELSMLRYDLPTFYDFSTSPLYTERVKRFNAQVDILRMTCDSPSDEFRYDNVVLEFRDAVEWIRVNSKHEKDA